MRRFFFSRAAATGAVLLVGLYAGAFLHASLSSEEVVLPVGKSYHFCGFYLDCHLNGTVEGVREEPLGQGRSRFTVPVRFGNDARRATLTLDRVQATLVADGGVAVGPLAGPTGLALSPDSSAAAEFVFEAPAGLQRPRLLVHKGGWQERLSELFLLGDPDSWLHAPVTLALR